MSSSIVIRTLKYFGIVPLEIHHCHPRAIYTIIIMCIQTIGICPYSHREHLELHWCSLLISRGLWNPFDCSAFDSLEIDTTHWKCQTCLDQAAGRNSYLDAPAKLRLWRSFFRRFNHKNRRTKRCTAWEMQIF